MFNGIFYLLRNGCSWRHLPHEFPPWGTTHFYDRRFRIGGTLARFHGKLREKVRHQARRKPTTRGAAGILDSQTVKTDAP